jgi:hypothetical protein
MNFLLEGKEEMHAYSKIFLLFLVNNSESCLLAAIRVENYSEHTPLDETPAESILTTFRDL